MRLAVLIHESQSTNTPGLLIASPPDPLGTIHKLTVITLSYVIQ